LQAILAVTRPNKALLPRTERRRWWSRGPSRRQGRALNALTAVAACCMLGGLVLRLLGEPQAASAGEPASGAPSRPSVVRTLGAALTDSRSTTTAYVDDAALAFLEPLRGRSGKVRAAFRTPGGELGTPEDPHLEAVYGEGEEPSDFHVPEDPGVYKLRVQLGQARREVRDLSVITLVPFSAKKDDKVGLYYLGRWPYESGGTPKSPAYANPTGFVEVTRENKDTLVSEHFRLGDFLTKDQANVWPKYVVIEPKLVDKLELIVLELEKKGVDVRHMQVMSGFRTPRYNKAGGNTAGRASLSRHMYGDAVDIFVDNDRNGTMDDINRDGRVDTGDAEMIGEAAERVERAYPALSGGVGVYKTCCGHGPFTHIDTRGYRARWRGEGTG
jgi:uncharacterized protein YcbK (DUF882 family)